MTTDNRITISRLNGRREHRFKVDLSPARTAELAGRLGVSDLRKLRFEGKLIPQGKKDWRLKAELGATVVQECVVTLDPVTTRIDEVVERQYLAELPEPSGEEMEMTDDDSIESLPDVIDLTDVLEESLVLAVPDYPRKEGAEAAQTLVSEPGTVPLSDEDVKPFAGLAALRDKLADKD